MRDQSRQLRRLPIMMDSRLRSTPEPEGDSQSSLATRQPSSIGVPTFQDMAVSEIEDCEPPANRLPAEVLISIFSKLSTSVDLLNCMLVSKRWARNSVDLLWHRPACTSTEKHALISRTLSYQEPYFFYKDFIKRLNMATLAKDVTDEIILPLAVCKRIERLTLTNCFRITDVGLTEVLKDCNHLLALDISGDLSITQASMMVLAQNCHKLQGLNISGCYLITNESMIAVAQNCKYIKRLKLNDCHQLENSSITEFAQNCPNLLEIDLHQCRQIEDEPVTEIIQRGQTLRELRLANCELITDYAFLSLPNNKFYEQLRILDLTSCLRLTDRAVEKIITVAPRLRNLVFAKCKNLTNEAVFSISKLGKNLHYLHLGHCIHITDEAVIKLVHSCNRIRYIDLGCCTHLTDESITKLATLPKLRRVGLVKCHAITDRSIFALAHVPQRRLHPGQRGDGSYGPGGWEGSSSLERLHLSYCVNLKLKSMIVLLNNCDKLTHLSLTGVAAFLRPDLARFCREAPPEFTENQRSVFCVYSGAGVIALRAYLRTPEFSSHPLNEEEDDDQTMTGPIGATTVVVEDEDNDGNADEELDDGETHGGGSFDQHT